MLYISNLLNLENLFEHFNADIKKNWKDPFNPPIVIFSDIKVEQWFKINWIKNRQTDSVLLNLNPVRLEEFMFKSVASGIKDNKIWYERLSEDVLRDSIVQKLLSDTSNGKYYQELKSDSVTSYIENSDGTINEVRLYNFAQKIANLFVEYMNTRSNNFYDGIYNNWMDDNNQTQDFFKYDADDEVGKTTDKIALEKKELKELEKWQKLLFKEIFKDGALSVKNDDEIKTEYVTLAQLVHRNRQSNEGKKINFGIKNSDVFIFGFSGMGKAYCQLLNEMSKDLNVHVYLQASDYQEAKNPLLKKWNQTGHETLTFWKACECKEFNNPEITINESPALLGELQNQIAKNEYDNQKLNTKTGDGTISFVSAPSRLREIEYVHSSICSIIDKKKKSNESVSYSDFVVLAPNIQDYRVPVMQIFDQNERNQNNGFPYVPYVFSDYMAEYSAVSEAVGLLVSMLNNKALDRKVLFAFLRNAVVRNVKGYSFDQLSSWSNWAAELNGYRDRQNSKQEWIKLSRRLMLAKLSDNTLKCGSEAYTPYSDMESEDSDSLYKFVDAIDKLETWIDEYSVKTELTESDVDKISEFFADWLKLKKDDSNEFAEERIVYSALKEEISNYRLIFKFGIKTINAKSFFIALRDSAQSSKSSSLNLFTGGITFGNFALNRTIPAKYVYLIGMDSKSFPGTDTSSSLDLRSKLHRQLLDDTIQGKNKEAFLCQLMATRERLYLSYVNKDLKKDEDFFRSSVLDELIDCIKNPSQKNEELELRLNIDEDRDWKDLYTQREFRNKRNYKNLINASDEVASEIASTVSVIPEDRVSISSMKSFLINPFVYTAKRIFDSNDDETYENESLQYEPLKLSALENSKMLTEIVVEYFAENNGDIEAKVAECIESRKNRGLLPDKIYGEVAIAELKNLAVKTIYMIESFKNDNNLESITFKETRNLPVMQAQDNSKQWLMMGTLSGYYWDTQNNKLWVLDIVTSSKIKKQNYLSAYLSALMLLAMNEANVNTTTEVELVLFQAGNNKMESKSLVNRLSKEAAIEILGNIYKQMYIEAYNKFISVESINTVYDDWNDFYKDAKQVYEWLYYSKKNLFDPMKHFGYVLNDINNSFENQYIKASALMKSLIQIQF